MATEAQIAANRRNATKSTGPRTQEGKSRSSVNALDHGFRANILVLPSEEFGEYEAQLRGYRASLQPRNLIEEFIVERLVSLGWQQTRIVRAETARLTKRMTHGWFEEDDAKEEKVVELGQKLFRHACGTRGLSLQNPMSESSADGEPARISDYRVDEDQPRRLIIELQSTGTGCRWLLDEWARLRDLLDQGMCWLAPDKLKAVRLLGRHPVDAVDYKDVAQVYLASHVLLKQEGEPFQEILNELSPEEATRCADYLRMRQYDKHRPKDAMAARRALLDIVDRTTEVLESKAATFRELDEINMNSASARLSWDDTPEGERLRRYYQACSREWHKMLDLLGTIRRTGEVVDTATIASYSRSAPTFRAAATEIYESTVADVFIQHAQAGTEPATANDPNPVPEPAPNEPNPVPEPAPNEPNPVPEPAPNEPNSHVQAPTGAGRDNQKEFRIDMPHLERKVVGIRSTGDEKYNPALDRLEAGVGSLLNLSSILGKK